jgi:hypothetical protein
MDYAVRPTTVKETKLGRRLALVGLSALSFLFSLWYLDAYYLGDQKFYQQFYYSLYQTSPEHWARLQEVYLGSSEPLYRYLIGSAARYDIDRIFYLSIWNALLVTAISYMLLKYRSSFLFGFLLLTNYYLFVLLGPAERLKFAYLCLIMGFVIDNVRARFVFSALSIFFHTQALVQFASAAAYYLADNMRAIFASPLRLLILVVLGSAALALVLSVFFNLVGTSVILKMEVYSNDSEGILEAVQWGMVLVGGLLVFDKRIAYFVGMLPMGVLTILFGNRVNVATLVLFAVLAITQRKTRHPLVLAVMAYMSLKSIPFLLDVVKYGTGY